MRNSAELRMCLWTVGFGRRMILAAYRERRNFSAAVPLSPGSNCAQVPLRPPAPRRTVEREGEQRREGGGEVSGDIAGDGGQQRGEGREGEPRRERDLWSHRRRRRAAARRGARGRAGAGERSLEPSPETERWGGRAGEPEREIGMGEGRRVDRRRRRRAADRRGARGRARAGERSPKPSPETEGGREERGERESRGGREVFGAIAGDGELGQEGGRGRGRDRGGRRETCQSFREGRKRQPASAPWLIGGRETDRQRWERFNARRERNQRGWSGGSTPGQNGPKQGRQWSGGLTDGEKGKAAQTEIGEEAKGEEERRGAGAGVAAWQRRGKREGAQKFQGACAQILQRHMRNSAELRVCENEHSPLHK